MAETISIEFPSLSGSVVAHSAFLRSEAGTLLNTGGDVITETGTTGVWTFTLAETRVAGTDYFVRIYSGSTEVAANLAKNGILYAGQTFVDKPFIAANVMVIRGTVGATPTPSTTAFTPSAVFPSSSVLNQWAGREIVFDNATTTVALRGQATDITGSSAAALPLLTFTAMTTAPVSGDTFSIR